MMRRAHRALGPVLVVTAASVAACRSAPTGPSSQPAGSQPASSQPSIEVRAEPGLRAATATVATTGAADASGSANEVAKGPVFKATDPEATVQTATAAAVLPNPIPAGKPDPRVGKAVIPEAGSEGPRDLAKLSATFQKVVTAQPYGKPWKDVVHVGPAPKESKELGKADTHPALSNDPIEIQQQVQFLEETGTEARYGFVTVRAVRVWRYGKLAAIRLVLDKLGRETTKDAFTRDVDAIGAVWKNVPAALSLGNGFKMVKNDLIEQKALKPAEYPKAPLSIELVPMERS